MEAPTIQAVYDRLMELSKQENARIDDVMEFLELAAAFLGWPCFDSDQADDNFSMQFKQGGL